MWAESGLPPVASSTALRLPDSLDGVRAASIFFVRETFCPLGDTKGPQRYAGRHVAATDDPRQ